jgi:hypothetical protein
MTVDGSVSRLLVAALATIVIVALIFTLVQA